jgi:hypothetical protein
MTRKIEVDWRPEEFTPVGVLKVSQGALELVRGVGVASRRAHQGKQWVASFHWYLSERVRYPGADWGEVQAPGLDIGAYERSEIPPDRIEVVDGLEFAIAIPKDICEAAAERLIDVAGDGSTKLVLR